MLSVSMVPNDIKHAWSAFTAFRTTSMWCNSSADGLFRPQLIKGCTYVRFKIARNTREVSRSHMSISWNWFLTLARAHIETNFCLPNGLQRAPQRPRGEQLNLKREKKVCLQLARCAVQILTVIINAVSPHGASGFDAGKKNVNKFGLQLRARWVSLSLR